MSDTMASLSRKLASADDLRSVVRTMKALAASSIGQYERSVLALTDYRRSVDLGLGACFRQPGAGAPVAEGTPDTGLVGAVVFGSDQGLVGQFNEEIADFAAETLASLGGAAQVWAVGERVESRLADAGLDIIGRFPVPGSVQGIAPLVGRLLVAAETHRVRAGYSRLYLFHNQPSDTLYGPVCQRLLPLDGAWQEGLKEIAWPTKNPPELLGSGTSVLGALIREHLFLSCYRACAESLASENASRLAAMERAEQNIGEMLETLQRDFHRLRQSSIDEELFDVVAGCEPGTGKPRHAPAGTCGNSQE